MTNLLGRLPPSPARRRPSELIHAADERPPGGVLALLGLQHAATALAFIAYVLATARIAGLSVPATQSLVAVALLGMAACTALQAWGGRLGSGALLVHMPNPFIITLAGAALVTHGPGAMVGITVVSALTTLAVGPLMSRLRALFPPAVAGTVICMAGLALVEPSVRHALGVDAQMRVDAVSVLISAGTLVCIVALSVWGGRRLRLLGLLAGMALGLVVAAVAGRLDGASALAGAPVLALPSLHAPVFALEPGLLLAIVLVAVLTQLDTLGSVVIMDKMDNADWRRADMAAVGGGIRANGLGDLLTAWLGSFPTAACSANIALAHATRSTSRLIGLAAAVLLALVAFAPKATLALTLIPAPVLGAVELYAAAFLMVSGIELIASRALDSRGIFMVGLSLSAGLVVMLMPGLVRGAPAGLQFFVGSGFIVAGLCAIVLNLLFRLGTGRQAERTLEVDAGALQQQITDFIEAQGAGWGARREVVRRAALAALEGAEAIAAAGGRRLQAIRGSFDEFNLDIELLHTGEPLALTPAAAPAVQGAAWWEADDADLDAALSSVSGLLIRHLADRVSTRPAAAGELSAALRLHFDH